MELYEYQDKAMQTKMATCDNFSYMMLNLVAEVGEFAGKVAKAIRNDESYIQTNDYYDESSISEKHETELKKEAGDILWQLAGLCDVMGWNLEEVAEINLAKLADRAKRNVINGNGDNR